MTDLLPTDAILAVETAHWTDADERFAWGYYVPEAVRRAWDRLPVEARAVAFLFASDLAQQDEMDF